jgi:hypothetical protein
LTATSVPTIPLALSLIALLTAGLLGCPSQGPTDDDDDDASTPPLVEWECVLVPAGEDDFARSLGCQADFDALASLPLDASIPGARSVKTVMDRLDGDAQYFQNSGRYPIHWDFAVRFLGPPSLPPVGQLAQFNQTEYFSPDRRFVLGAVTYYEGPGVWAWELSPYDTASAEMIAAGYRSVRDNAWFGPALRFHATSEALQTVAADLPDDVGIVTTDELFAGIDYQPLNLSTSMGQLRFVDAASTDDVTFREIVVLEAVPNDISVVAGIITQQFQTPLSHINVLSQNRGTPNMGLRGAWSDPELRALDGQWVELVVDAFDWQVRAVSAEEAEAWWQANRPAPIDVGPMDLSVTGLTDIEDVLDLASSSLEDALAAAVPAFGGKATHFAALSRIPEIPNPRAFAVPVSFFERHMRENGLWARFDTMVADPRFASDRSWQREQLDLLRTAIVAAPIHADDLRAVLKKLAAEFPDTRMRFRSSTNAEDVNGFNGAGLYTSKTGDPGDPDKPVDLAMKQVWASVYRDRAWDEREYYSIDHRNIGMALLVHRSFPDEDANGVAITANIFDPSGFEPAFYVNVQAGGESVVLPDPGVTTDQLLYYYTQPGQPIVYLFHSSLVAEGDTVLSTEQAYTLGAALQAVHEAFFPVYAGAPGEFYGMDVEFKFDATGGNGSQLFIKQARPYPGWGTAR